MKGDKMEKCPLCGGTGGYYRTVKIESTQMYDWSTLTEKCLGSENEKVSDYLC